METRPIPFLGRFPTISVVTLLAFASFLGGPPARAGERGAFRGAYHIKNVVDLGGQVRLTLSLHLFNLSGAPVTDAAVTLRDSHLRPKVYGEFRSVSLRPGESIQLSREFTIPHREYHRWQKGVRPNIVIEFRDSTGSQVQREVGLIHRATGGKE